MSSRTAGGKLRLWQCHAMMPVAHGVCHCVRHCVRLPVPVAHTGSWQAVQSLTVSDSRRTVSQHHVFLLNFAAVLVPPGGPLAVPP